MRDGKLKILLITSSSGKRWIIPKGIVDPDLTPEESAAREAYEEAGVKGTVIPGSIGKYHYKKWGGTCTIEVFLLKVEKEFSAWPESSLRTRRWVSPKKAAKLLDVSELRKLIQGVAGRLREIAEPK